MGEAQLIELLINGGANAAFAGFLLWQFFYQQKRLDARDEKSEKREDTLRERYEGDQQALRDRYDSVISMYQLKEEKIRDSLVAEIAKIDVQITQIGKNLDDLSAKLQALSDIVNELKMREIARSQINSGIAPNLNP